MPKLEIRGRLDVDQFWPDGNADADTVVIDVEKVLVDGHASDVFDDAFVFDHGKRRKVLAGGKVRIRLEGIDAPELHHVKAPQGDDVGPFVFPKLFRRLAVHEVHRGQVRGFKSWLRERRDLVRPMLGWLEQGVAAAEAEDFADYVSDDSSKPRFLVEPDDLVFIEKAGITYGKSGTPLHEWPD